MNAARNQNAEGQNAEGQNAEGQNAEGQNAEGQNAEGQNEARQNEARGNSEGVVLLHGLTGHSILLRPIRRHLEKLGYQVYDWSYWSLPYPIESHTQRLREDVVAWAQAANLSRIHMVGHSMGGIIIRALLATKTLPGETLSRVGNIVQVVPPNHGSPIASRCYRCGIKFKALDQLSDIDGSFVTTLADPSPDFCMGILAASRDRVVPLANTPLEQTADYQVVKAGHTTILFRRRTIRLVGSFIQHSRFVER